MLESKKFRALLVGLLLAIAVPLMVRFLDVTPEEAQEIAGPITTKIVALVAAYMAAQGVADHGKEAAKIDG